MKLLKILVIAAVASLLVASVALAGTQTQQRDQVRTPDPTCTPTCTPTGIQNGPNGPQQTSGVQLKTQKRDQTCDNQDRTKQQKRDQTCDNQDRTKLQQRDQDCDTQNSAQSNARKQVRGKA